MSALDKLFQKFDALFEDLDALFEEGSPMFISNNNGRIEIRGDVKSLTVNGKEIKLEGEDK